MTDSKNHPFIEGAIAHRAVYLEDDFDPLTLVDRVYYLWWTWADFHLYVVSPVFDTLSPPVVIPAEPLAEGDGLEFVYPIYDHGYKLSVSKAEDFYTAGCSMCKLYYTIEKMINLLIERFKVLGIDQEKEVQVAFYGHQLAQRKAFESVINLSYNVVVTNFEPGTWGERYLQTAKRLADKGYGYPSEAPRTHYREARGLTSAAKRA